jgi:hypothetical protein
MKADPEARIVAVDPKFHPHSPSCGSEARVGTTPRLRAGSGYRLDVLIASTHEAMDYGKQDRFVIVVPPEHES